MEKQQNKELSKRIATLVEHFDFDYDDRCDDERTEIYQRAFAANQSADWPRKIAEGFVAFLKEKRIFIRDYDLIAGNVEQYDYSASLPLPLKEGGPAHSRDYYGIDEEIDHCIEAMNLAEDAQERHLLEELRKAEKGRLYYRWGIGHTIPGYTKILDIGFDALIAEGEAALQNQSDQAKRKTIENMLMVDKAVQSYILRYCQEAERLHNISDNPEYKKSLKRIMEACQRAVHLPPSNFFEAIQLFMLTYDAIICENKTGSLSIGRVDQFLYPYYEKDLAAGLLTREEAVDLIAALWLKIARARRGYQNVTLGGIKADGTFAGNDLTFICMEAMDLVRTDQPLLSLRCTKDMPKEYWQAAIDLVRTGLGFPAVYNDELIIATKTKLGVAEEDMWNYALMGCVEPVIPGKEYSYQGECLLSWGKVLELVLFDGYNESSGVEIEMAEKHELVEFVTFTDFYEWFKRELLFFIDRGIQQSKLLNAVQYKRWPIAFLSSTMDGPYKSGKDVTAGGAKYSFGTLNAIGMADVVDSLQAIKELVFERKQLSLTEFSEILKNDYVGSEALLNEVLNLSNKYGNDVKEVDAMMKELTDLAAAAISAQTNQWGNPYQASYISVQHHGYMGKYTAALPNGRRRGAAMANSLAPCQGAERSGPTATVNSVTTVDHGKLANCMVFDLKFSPAFLASPAHQEGLINLIKTYFAKGGMEMQINVVDRETLVNAQKNPEQYKNLIVRVSGFSAHFIYLDKTVQDELIKRTEHA